jgi:hypothetical protein
VVASRSGFRPRRVETVLLPVDRAITLDLQLDVGTDVQVVVRAQTPAVDRSRSSLSSIISPETIEVTPLNGRNYLDLIRLTPGVVVNDRAGAALSDRDTRGAILGERAGNVSFLIDGLWNNDDVRGGALQSLTQDTVQEFEVVAAGYNAEFGRGSTLYANLRDEGAAPRAVERFYQMIDAPILTDVTIDWNGLPVSDAFPARLPDLFAGRTIDVVAKYTAPAAGTAIVRGRIGARRVEFPVEIVLPKRSETHEGLGSVWARQRSHDLSREMPGAAAARRHEWSACGTRFPPSPPHVAREHSSPAARHAAAPRGSDDERGLKPHGLAGRGGLPRPVGAVLPPFSRRPRHQAQMRSVP